MAYIEVVKEMSKMQNRTIDIEGGMLCHIQIPFPEFMFSANLVVKEASLPL